MKRLSNAILATALFLCPACTTTQLWEDTDPENRILLEANTTSEKTLRKLGVEYTAIEVGEWKGYSVEKSRIRKALDYQLRLAGTPPALALDAAGTLLALLTSNPEIWCGVIESLLCSISD
ncbi:MAG: hypothetical protein AB7V22_08080 [Kiritimatiellia bacterium]